MVEVDYKCKPGALASTMICLCCLYMAYKPTAAGRKLLKSEGIPVPFNVTLLICCLSCCMSSHGVTLLDCGLQYAGLKQKLEEAILGKPDEEK